MKTPLEPSFTTGFVTSRDGTRIGYRKVGSGPALVAVQGAMGSVHNYDQLARALAPHFTVYYADRRGRGVSPCAYGPERSSIGQEVEDVDALLSESGAQCMFGLSSGAIITLECARVLPSVTKAVVYEPPFYLHGGVPCDLIARFHGEVDKGHFAAALVTVNDIVRLSPAVLRFVPRPLLEMAMRAHLQRDERIHSGKYLPLRELIPAMRFDFQVVKDRGDDIALYRSVPAEILLLGGNMSPSYLKNALQALMTILPNAQRHQFAALDHSAPWNLDRGGAPEVIARGARDFLAGG